MEKERYYFRHKRDQELFIYLENSETWEDSFIMEFRKTESVPHYLKTGALYENRHILLAFNCITFLDYTDLTEDKKIEWFSVKADAQLKYSVQTFISSFFKIMREEKEKQATSKETGRLPLYEHIMWSKLFTGSQQRNFNKTNQ